MKYEGGGISSGFLYQGRAIVGVDMTFYDIFKITGNVGMCDL